MLVPYLNALQKHICGAFSWRVCTIASIIIVSACSRSSSAGTPSAPNAKPLPITFRAGVNSPPAPVKSIPVPSDASIFARPTQPAVVSGQGFAPDAERIVDLTELQISLEKYRVAKGRYPESLSDLFPAFAPQDNGHPVGALPVDPETHKPYTFVPLNDGAGYHLSATLSSGKSYTRSNPAPK
jgi:hypothetical protein